jgi:serine/threonine-protein phosphatase CPPED1
MRRASSGYRFNRSSDQPSRIMILENSGVRYDFAGHFHRNSEGQMEALTMVTTGPVGKPLGTRELWNAGGDVGTKQSL